MRTKTSLILLITFFALTASAAELVPIGEIRTNPSWLTQVISKVRQCTWRIPCYWRQSLGAGSITAISGTTLVSDLDTILTNNNTYFDERKVNIASTSWPQLTTAAGLTTASALVTVGTITSGTWQADITSVTTAGFGTATPASILGVRGNIVQSSGAAELLTIRASSIVATSTLLSGFGTSTPTGLLSIEQTGVINSGNWMSYALFIGDSGTSTPTFTVSAATSTVSIATSSPPIYENKLLIGGNIKTQGQAYSDVVQLAYTATTTIDCSRGKIFRVTMTGATTFDFKNCYSGMTFIIKAIQDGTGGRTISIPSTALYTFTKNLVGTPTTSANAINHIGGYWDGNVFNILAATATPPQ